MPAFEGPQEWWLTKTRPDLNIRSLRFNSTDSAYLSRTPTSAGNRKTWTWSGWVKRSGFVSNRPIFGTNFLGSSYCSLYFDGNNTFFVENYISGFQLRLQTAQVFRDPSAWYHIVVALDTTQGTASDRCKIYVNGSQVTAFSISTYPSQNTDLLINNNQYHEISTSSSSYGFNGYLAEVHFIDGQALDPTRFGYFDSNGIWQLKNYIGAYGTNGFHLDFADNSSNAALGTDTSGNGNDWTVNNLSTGTDNFVSGGLTYRDSSTANQSWDQSSASSSTSNAIGPDDIWWVDLGQVRTFNEVTFNVVASGQGADTSTNFIVHFSSSSSSLGSNICGGGCTIISAGQPSGSTPGTISVTFDGFSAQVGRYIGISNGSGGQGGTYTYSNLAVISEDGTNNDSLVDFPTNGSQTDTGVGGEVRGNYATLNPLFSDFFDPAPTISNGNLEISQSSSQRVTYGTIAVSSGKWYWEITIASGTDQLFGITDTSNPFVNNTIYNQTGSYYYYPSLSRKYVSGSFSSYGNTISVGDVIGVALDLDAGTITFYENGTSLGVMASSLPAATYVPGFGAGNNNAVTQTINFGQRAFAYQAPSGFKALCTTNLPTPTIADGSNYMDVALYTGNGTSQTISGYEFSPDFVWVKQRNTTRDHRLANIISGVGKDLRSNTTNSEITDVNGITAFNSDGFSVGSNTGWNQSAGTYVGFCWDAGSSTVSNTDGSITSSVRANANAGFSIVTYTGTGANATVGHGLNAPIGMLIIKNRDDAKNWVVGHSALATGNSLRLNLTDAVDTAATIFNSTDPTSSVFSVGTNISVNGSGDNLVAYCFAPVEGYSAFGSYTGNGSSDGPFVFLNFRARWIMFKRVAAADPWIMYDTARSPYNQLAVDLAANDSRAEAATSAVFDITSNGFKLRNSGTIFNQNGEQYIYCAFAENPFALNARAR